jgi:uncharacterized glyoxalase superfamily protein PhnB
MLRYRDVAAAIDWLCNAFGFEKHQVVWGGDGAVRYAELTFGNGMIMLRPIEDSSLDKFMAQPADTGGAETQICYLFIADAAAHCARAKAAGVEIVLDIEAADSNERGYSCRDLEGHIWNFGNYDPQKRRSARTGEAGRDRSTRRALRWPARAAVLSVLVLVCVLMVPRDAGVNLYRFELVADAQRSAAERSVENVQQQVVREREAREATERLVRTLGEQLTQARAARQAAERAAADIERKAEDARQRVARRQSAIEAEQRTAQETLARLSQVERKSQTHQALLAEERTAREAAEHAMQETQEAREKLAKERKDKARHRTYA